MVNLIKAIIIKNQFIITIIIKRIIINQFIILANHFLYIMVIIFFRKMFIIITNFNKIIAICFSNFTPLKYFMNLNILKL